MTLCKRVFRPPEPPCYEPETSQHKPNNRERNTPLKLKLNYRNFCLHSSDNKTDLNLANN